MKKSKIILLGFLLFIAVQSIAQIQQPLRVEYDEDLGDGFNVHGFEEKKVVLVRYNKKNPDVKKETLYSYETLDESLKKTKSASISISSKWDYISTFDNDNFQYMLSYNRKKGDFLLLKVDPQTLDISKTTGVFSNKFYVEEWFVQGDYMYVAGLVKKIYHIMVVDIRTGKVNKFLPQSMTAKDIVFMDVERIKTPTGYEIGFQYSAEIKRKQHETYLLRFSENGEKIGNFLVLPKPDEDTELLSTTLTKLSNGNYAVTGSYSKGKKGFSNGIYFASLSEQGINFIKYYNFLDLNNFTSYLSERWREKIEKKQAKKEEKGEELNLNYRVTTHDILELDGNYIFLGEFYYPTYRTETYTTTNANGQIVYQHRQVFDGYQYSHAAIAAFNPEGKMEWSNAFDMYVYNKPYYVKQFIHAGIDKYQIKLMYITGSEIKAVSFDTNGKEAKSRTVEMVSTNHSGDKVRYTWDGACDYWYDNNFISSGFQKIKNNDNEPGNKKRSVNFINKISF